jgi:hypothetical protein
MVTILMLMGVIAVEKIVDKNTTNGNCAKKERKGTAATASGKD